jgi:hypothetical protein
MALPRWLPWYEGSVRLALSATEVRQALGSLVDEDAGLLGAWSSRLPYRGHIHAGDFTIRPAGLSRNALRPVIAGTITDEPPQAHMVFRVRPAGLPGIFLLLWLLSWLGGGVGLFVHEYRAGRGLSGWLLLPFAVVALVGAAWVWTVRSAGRAFEERLRQLGRGARFGSQ